MRKTWIFTLLGLAALALPQAAKAEDDDDVLDIFRVVADPGSYILEQVVGDASSTIGVPSPVVHLAVNPTAQLPPSSTKLRPRPNASPERPNTQKRTTVNSPRQLVLGMRISLSM